MAGRYKRLQSTWPLLLLPASGQFWIKTVFILKLGDQRSRLPGTPSLFTIHANPPPQRGDRGASQKCARCEADLTFFSSNCVFFSLCCISALFIYVSVVFCVCVCVRVCACVCVCSNSMFLPIRHSMTGHVAKQLARLFVDQQLWEEI